MLLAEYLGLDRKELNARIIMAQGRQNTNYAIKDFLTSRDFPGYRGYQSDSEVPDAEFLSYQNPH